MANQMPSPGDFLKALIDKVEPIIKNDGASISSFGVRQLEALRDQAIVVGEGVLLGDFKDRPKLLEHHLRMLKVLAENFAKTTAGLAVITVEKVINGLVDVVWSTIEKAVGFAVPRP